MTIFLDTDISQGSVITQLRCGGLVNDDFVGNLPVNLPVKVFWKSVDIWRSYGQWLVFYWLTVYSGYSPPSSWLRFNDCFPDEPGLAGSSSEHHRNAKHWLQPVYLFQKKIFELNALPTFLSSNRKEVKALTPTSENYQLARLKPNSITLAGSKLVRSWSQTGSKLVSDQLRTCFEPVCDQLQTS